MKKFAIRQVETVKTTAAFYGCECCPTAPWCQGQDQLPSVIILPVGCPAS